MNLILLAKIEKVETFLHAAQFELDAIGLMIENKREAPNPNLILSVVDTIERCQPTVIEPMRLNQTASDPRTINGSAKVTDETRATMKEIGVQKLSVQR